MFSRINLIVFCKYIHILKVMSETNTKKVETFKQFNTRGCCEAIMFGYKRRIQEGPQSFMSKDVSTFDTFEKCLYSE